MKQLNLGVLNTRHLISRHPSIPKAVSHDQDDDVVFLFDRTDLEKEKVDCHSCQLAGIRRSRVIRFLEI